MASKLPSFQFYPGDWITNPGLRACSRAAKGLWIDLLCLMALSERRGVLVDGNGNPLRVVEIARATGADVVDVPELIEELARMGVLKRNDGGAIYSGRMIREEARRATRERLIRTTAAPLPFKRPRVKVRESVRRRVLGEGACACCGATKNLTVDHKRPWSWGGSNARSNLQCLCWDCNLAKSNRWSDAGGRRDA